MKREEESGLARERLFLSGEDRRVFDWFDSIKVVRRGGDPWEIIGCVLAPADFGFEYPMSVERLFSPASFSGLKEKIHLPLGYELKLFPHEMVSLTNIDLSNHAELHGRTVLLAMEPYDSGRIFAVDVSKSGKQTLHAVNVGGRTILPDTYLLFGL